MPKYYVRQPNGKIALYSTIVDDWLYKDLSEREFHKLFCERNGIHSFKKALEYIDKWTDYKECKRHIKKNCFWIGSKVRNYTSQEIDKFVNDTGYEIFEKDGVKYYCEKLDTIDRLFDKKNSSFYFDSLTEKYGEVFLKYSTATTIDIYVPKLYEQIDTLENVNKDESENYDIQFKNIYRFDSSDNIDNPVGWLKFNPSLKNKILKERKTKNDKLKTNS